MNEPITYTKASGADIDRILTLMESVLSGQDEQHIVMACLALALMIQIPNIKLEQITAGVKGASEWITLFASELESPTTTDRMN